MIDIFWSMKSLLGKVLLDRNDAKDNILLVLNDIQLQLKDMDAQLACTEVSVATSPSPNHYSP